MPWLEFGYFMPSIHSNVHGVPAIPSRKCVCALTQIRCRRMQSKIFVQKYMYNTKSEGGNSQLVESGLTGLSGFCWRQDAPSLHICSRDELKLHG